MASGGQQTPSRGIHQSSVQVNQHGGGNEFGDSQWTLLPNNLELNSRSRPAKKQRNKEKIRKVVSTESSPSPQSSPCAARNCNHPYAASSSYPRTKFTATSWHNGQMASGALKKNITSSDMEETTSDNELISMERGTVERVSSQRPQESKFPDWQTPSSRRVVVDSEHGRSYKEDNTKKVPDASIIIERLIHLRECIKQVTSLMQNLEKSDEPIAREQMNKLDYMLTQLHQEEEEHLELLQQMLDSSHSAELSDGPVASHLSTPGSFALLPSREVNGISEDERMDHKDQILKKMMESQKKLTALQQQQEALLSLQKKAKDKLAEAKAFHEQLVKASSSDNQDKASFQTQDWQYAASDRSYHSACAEESIPNGNTDWEGEQSDVQVARPVLTVRTERKTHSNGQGKRNSNASSGWQEETREMAATNALNANLENLRHRVQVLQERNDNRKMTSQCNDQEDEEECVEWHRQKLENKLRELQEKKQQMNQLLQELSSLQEASKSGIQQSVASGDGDVPVETVASLRDAQQFLETVDTGEKRRKLDHMKETLRHLRAMVNNIGSPVNGEEGTEFENLEKQVQKEKTESLLPQQPRHSSQTKRDNISREQCSGFPARRHYEAEGRANEDTDMAPPVVANSPPLSPRAPWDADPQIQEKMRQLQDAKDKLQKVQGLLAVVQQSKTSGETLPVEYLHLLASFDDEDEPGGGESNQRKDEAIASQNSSKNVADGEMTVVQRRPRETVRIDDIKERIQQQENTLEHFKEERNKLLALQEQLVRLQQTPESSVKNNDQIRSSGEGDSLQKKPQFSRSGSVFPPSSDAEHIQISREKPRQGNLLLTRQNVAIMESQSQASTENNTAVKARDIASAKKDNINSLSANLTRKMLANSPACISSEQSLESRAAASLSALTAELSQNLSLRDEMCRKKAAIEELLGQDQSKQQSYSRNQDTQSHSGSSVISGPLEGSSSVLAPDTTVAATWGGSSTQDNFENEVEEPVESLEEQEGSGNESQVEGGVQNDQSRYISMQQFPGEQVYVEHGSSVSTPLTRRDNRIGKKQSFKSQDNQQVTRKNFQRIGGNRKFPSYEGMHQENLSTDIVVDEQECVNQQPTAVADGSSGLVYWHKFTQQFQQQLEHMNALCQSVLQEQQVLTSRLLSCSFSSPTLLANRSSHPVIPDLLHQYTHQLQQQQQLLLSLSQCYHMLYLQQIEIQHLQKCLQQSPDSEGTIHQTPPLNNQGPSTEEFNLRPWPMAPIWNAPLSFSQTQPSSLLATSFIQPSSFGYGPTHPAPNVSGCTSQNVRNNSGPEGRVVAETLNNQVPPRTRANNFWDNFRSYSRQNLLSTSAATKSNESASVGGGQARYSAQQPGVLDSTCWNSRTRDSLQPHVENGAVPSQASEDRQLDRPLPNPELQEMMTRPKKPNFSKPQVPANRVVAETVRRSPASLNLSTFTSLDQMSRPSTLSGYIAPNSRSGVPNTSSSSSANTNTPCPQHLGLKPREGAFDSVQESIYSEVAKLVAQNESHPDFLVELFQQLQQIQSDYLRQRALCAVRDMVACQGNDLRIGPFVDRTELDDNQSLSQLSKDGHLQSNHSQMDVPDQQSFLDGSNDVHNHSSSAISDHPVSGRCSSGDSGHCQENVMTSSTRPHQKPGICTGAVKKKSSKPSLPHSSVPQHITPVAAELEGFTHQNGANVHKPSLELLETQVERAVLGLVPFISSHLHEECSLQFQAHLINRVLESLKTLPQQHLTRLFRSQVLQNTLAKFTGKRISGCEDEMLMQISNVLFKEVALHKLTKKKSHKYAEDSQEGSETIKDENSMGEKDENARACNEFIPDQLKAQKDVATEYSEEPEEISRGDRKVSDHQSAASLVNMPEQEVSRGAACGEANAFVSRVISRNLQAGVGTAEEDMGCECDTEAETEPEVEAETEADLAEADQSPSQLGNTVDQLARHIESSLSVPDGAASALPGISGILQNISNNATSACVDDTINVEDEHIVNEEPIGQVAFSEGSLIQELTLDDIPTKLSPTPEEMLQRHIDEQAVNNTLHQEPLGDGEAAATGDGEITSETTDYYS